MQETEQIQVANDTAEAVLKDIDKLVRWYRDTSTKVEQGMMRLGALLYEAKRGAYWTYRGYESEEDYIHDTFPQSRSNYYALIGIAEHLSVYPRPLLEKLGRSKCEDLVRVKKHCGLVPENWFLFAQQDDRDIFRRRVRSYLNDGERPTKQDPAVEDEFISFRLFGDQIIIVRKALELAQRLLGSDKALGCALEIISVEFFNQYGEDGRRLLEGKNTLLMLTIGRLVEQLDLTNPATATRLISAVAAAIEKNTGTPG